MRELHPYGEFIPKKAKAMIVGSFPIGKFSNPKRRKEIKSHEYDFFFGGEKNLLWKLLAYAWDYKIHSKEDIIEMLTKKQLAIGDVIKSCHRKNGGASDADLFDIEWNHDLMDIIQDHGIKKIYFTSKKVEYWFHRLFPEAEGLEEITLISPSGQSIRSLGKRFDFRQWLNKNPGVPKVQFIYEFYRKKFRSRG